MNILDSRFKWTPSNATDVQAVWRRYGWRPLSEKITGESDVCRHHATVVEGKPNLDRAEDGQGLCSVSPPASQVAHHYEEEGIEPKTPLVTRLLELRQKYIDEGGKLYTMDEINELLRG